MSDHICGSPTAMCDADCMERAHMGERIAELEKALRVYGRHRSNCQIHFKDACTCGWDEAGKVIGRLPDQPTERRP